MFKFIRKKLLEGIIKDIAKEIPSIKDKALNYLEEHKDELLDKLQEVIKQAIKDFVASKINR